MSLIPQGASGSSGSGGTGTVYPTTGTVVPGAIYALDAWTGHSLRKLVVTAIATATFFSRVQIRKDVPTTLEPSQAPPGAYLDIPISTYLNGQIDLDFAPGLITVEHGERIYLVVYDWRCAGNGEKVLWTVNHYWEPIGGAK